MKNAYEKTEVMIEANTTNSTNYADFPQTVVTGQVTSGGYETGLFGLLKLRDTLAWY
jgi:hypothetical protein